MHTSLWVITIITPKDNYLVNSSWTDAHIRAIWKSDTRVVFPPCDTGALLPLPLTTKKHIISLAQFRPEKCHALQIKALAPVLKANKDLIFYMVGSVRNADDQKRVDVLKQLVKEVGINEHQIQIIINATQEKIYELLTSASIGMHTMRDEHFGIGIIEYMAAGVVPIAHCSGGPKADIIVDYYGKKVGYLAETEQEFTNCVLKVLGMSEKALMDMRMVTREAAKERFSSDMFSSGFLTAIIKTDKMV